MQLQQNDIILFNGDSITDRDRNRSEEQSLSGYNLIIANTLEMYRPDLNIKCYNRGVSGDTTALLLDRLEGELKAIKPSVFSLLLGINDTWRRYDNNIITTEEAFEQNYRLIFSTVVKYTKRIIIIEPFLLTSDTAKAKFREDLDPKIHIIRKLAAEFQAEFVPLDGIFAEESTKRSPVDFAEDGIHPTDLGHGVIAREWLKRVNLG